MFQKMVPDPGLINSRGQRVEKRDETSPADTNIAPPSQPPEPPHVLLTKGGQERRILKAQATPDVMSAFSWEAHHPADYREDWRAP
jgi:hypothetical protein